MSKKHILFTVLIILAAFTYSVAQVGLGQLKGFVVDENGAALVGATVTLSSPKMMGDRTVTTGAKGDFRFVNLPPGSYSLVVEKQDYKRFEQREMTISAGKTSGIEVKLELGAFEEVLTIVGEAPLIDVDSTKQKVNISGELQRMLPTTTRNNFSEILRLIPGTAMTDPNRPQYSYYAVKGASQYFENNWTVDGAKINQWEYSYMSARVNLDAVEDVQIDLSGANAVNPLGQGGTVHLTSKSGGNEFHGSGYVRYQPTSWNWTNIEGGTAADNDMVEYGGSLGGYLLKDKVWFFGTARFTEINEGLSRSPTALSRATSVFSSFSPDLIDKNMKDVFIKGTAMVSDDHLVTFSWQHDWGYETFAPWYYDPSAYIDEGTVGPLYNATWNWVVSDNLNVYTQFAYNNKDRDRFGRNPDQIAKTVYGSSYVSGGRRYGQDIIVTFGNYYGEFDVDELQVQFTSNATYYLDDFKGSHEVKFGIYTLPIMENQFNRYYPTSPARQRYVLSDPNDPGSEQLLYNQIIYDQSEYNFAKRKAENYAFFGNDVWKPTDNLTVEAGLRFDMVSQEDEVDGNVVPMVDLSALSPNIGFNYALTSDRKNIIRGSFSRRHQNVTAYTFPTSGQGIIVGYTEQWDVDLDGTLETTFRQNPDYIEPRFRDVDLHLGYTNDFTVGYSRELPYLMTLGVDYTYRQLKDRIQEFNTNPILDSNNVFIGVEDPTFPSGERWEAMNNIWSYIEWHSMDITLNRAFSDNFQFMASYTYEFGQVKGDWAPYNVHRLISPGKFDTYKRDWQDAGDRGHMFRFNAVYLAPYDITVATSVALQGGPRSDSLYENISSSDPDVTQYGPAWLFQDGNWVFNPYSTTTRYTGSDRKDGQWRSPMMALVNLRLGKQVDFRQHRFHVYFDVFNLFNSDTSLSPDARGRYNSTYFQEDNLNNIIAPRAAQVTFKYSF